MMKLALFVLVAVLLASCSLVEEDTPDGEGPHTKKIIRDFTNAFEENLILQAEDLYPNRDSVLAAASPRLRDSLPEENLWWYNSFAEIRIPYAITTDAITYYSDLIEVIKHGRSHPNIQRSTFVYSARVTLEEAFEIETKVFNRAYVVYMILKWEHFCGNLCALSMEGERVVVFDESGELIKVFRDGAFPALVA